MSNYLIELSAVHLALTLAYWFFLRKERQYATMRFYLIGSAVLALTVPLFKLPMLFSSETTLDVMPAEVTSLSPVSIGPTDEASFWSGDLLLYLYIATSVFFLYRFFNYVLRLSYLQRKSNYEKLEAFTFIRYGVVHPASAFSSGFSSVKMSTKRIRHFK